MYAVDRADPEWPVLVNERVSLDFPAVHHTMQASSNQTAYWLVHGPPECDIDAQSCNPQLYGFTEPANTGECK